MDDTLYCEDCKYFNLFGGPMGFQCEHPRSGVITINDYLSPMLKPKEEFSRLGAKEMRNNVCGKSAKLFNSKIDD